jgi:hypothetical protein
MDDGKQNKDRGITLCTDSFTQAEIGRLRDALRILYSLDTTLHKRTNKLGKESYRIYIRETEAWLVLVPQIAVHIQPIFLYKLNLTSGTIPADSPTS